MFGTAGGPPIKFVEIFFLHMKLDGCDLMNGETSDKIKEEERMVLLINFESHLKNQTFLTVFRMVGHETLEERLQVHVEYQENDEDE